MRNPTRVFYEFFDPRAASGERILEVLDKNKIDVVVINRAPEFSDQLPVDLLADLKAKYPLHAEIGQKFVVLWRDSQ
jgi:hypothetical protein